MSFGITRDFTVAVFVVHSNHVLLHPHKKLGLWLPPGGHIDAPELPDDAAVREVREEAGIDIEAGSDFMLTDGTMTPDGYDFQRGRRAKRG